jgi:16S rRNA G1207 methylase RsmC
METKEVRELKKDIIFHFPWKGEQLEFHSAWGLFSPRGIDEGSRLLLENVVPGNADKILDLGCGYGALGVILGKQCPGGQIHMVDSDFMAVEYARKNAVANGIMNAKCYTSFGFSSIADERFDLVVSNLPAKVGRELLWIILNDAKDHLNPGGRFCVVTISGLREFIKNNLKEVFGNYEKIKQGKSYTVACATKC